jgi:hypothetical protein
MSYFQTKNSNLGKFGRVLQWKILVKFMTIWSYLRPFGIFRGNLVNFIVIWYIFPILVCCTKKNLATVNLHNSDINEQLDSPLTYLNKFSQI